MPITLDAADFLTAYESMPVVDVRSPAEFQQGHIPGAINIPLFNDLERAEVGTLYVRSGRDQALLHGLDIILPKTKKILQTLGDCATGTKLRVYCWRGGLRSLNMAWLFETNGYHVSLLEGGYKAYRRFIRTRLDEAARVVVLGGFTGSGKTEVLNHIAESGEQVIDLEMLASHKGSAFGGIGLPDQPTNEQFENNLYDQWSQLDKDKFIWLEDESRMIGKVTLPDPMIRKIQESPMIVLEVPKKIRVERLVREYAGIDDRLLSEAVMKIETRLGKPRAKGALFFLQEKDYATVADQVITYYDKAYSFSIHRRKNQPRYQFAVSEFDPREAAKGLLEFAHKHLKNGPDLSGL
ncbi:MAG: tRNA 2-selenouridine(34) synthase MnmH [Bacteroidales bacterium]|nr:tRNA 2-selenouridine(34) synthase MnmH [Bacteroidales bacterium]